MGRSRDRDRKGHRILRRVLVGGRPLGSSRAIPFHEAMATVTLAASSLGMAATLVRAEAERSREGAPHPGPEGEATEESEVRSFCWRRGKKTPTLRAHVCGRRTVRRASRQDGKRVVQWRFTEAFASVVKHSVPRSNLRSPRLRGAPRGIRNRKTAERAGNTRGTGTRSRSGGRSRSYASRVLLSPIAQVARPVGEAGR